MLCSHERVDRRNMVRKSMVADITGISWANLTVEEKSAVPKR